MVAQPFLEEWVANAVARKIAIAEAGDPWYGPHGAARDSQRPPDGEWRTWLLLAGRGFGKTRTAAEWVRREIQERRATRVALVGSTAADVRDVMVEGISGLLASCRAAGLEARYEPSRRRVVFPALGAVAFTYSAEEPDRLRGPQHDLAWVDEAAAFKGEDAWDQLQFGLRLGQNPRQVVTTTPRPVPLIRRLVKDPTTATTRGSTYDNRDNLAPAFLEQIVARYEGTRLGRQELQGELLEDVEGALWSVALIDAARRRREELPELTRIVVAIDPQAGYSPDGDLSETGLVVCGRDAAGEGWVLADASGNFTPNEWAAKAVALWREWHADRIVAEANQGGVMVESTLRTVYAKAPVKLVRASRGKLARAEPVAALYEQGKVHHVGGFPELEDQMTGYVPDTATRSPDRMDALVWALTDLLLGRQPGTMQWV